MPIAIEHLGDDLLVQCLGSLSAVSLAASDAVCSHWRPAVRQVLVQKLADCVQRPPQEDCNLLLQLMSLERLEETVGKRPQRSWRDEFTEVMVVSMREQHRFNRDYMMEAWDANVEASYRAVFDLASLDRRIKTDHVEDIALAVRMGMPLALAQAFLVLGVNAHEALFSPRPHLAASSYVYYDALSTMARLKTATAIAPPVYTNLKGQYGLTELDDGWTTLRHMSVGERFVAKCSHTFQASGENCFPDGRADGYYMRDEDGELIYLSDDVVCIRSAPNDSCGRHNLIREVGEKPSRQEPGCWAMPPFAVVTLISVQDSWRVRRQTMKCRLYTCVVSFDLR